MVGSVSSQCQTRDSQCSQHAVRGNLEGSQKQVVAARARPCQALDRVAEHSILRMGGVSCTARRSRMGNWRPIVAAWDCAKYPGTDHRVVGRLGNRSAGGAAASEKGAPHTRSFGHLPFPRRPPQCRPRPRHSLRISRHLTWRWRLPTSRCVACEV